MDAFAQTPVPQITFDRAYTSASINYIPGNGLTTILGTAPGTTVYYFLDADPQTSTPSVYLQPFTLQPGTHTLDAYAVEADVNSSHAFSDIYVDTAAPQTSLLVDGVGGIEPEADGHIHINTDSSLSLAPSDLASGIGTSYYLIDPDFNNCEMLVISSMPAGSCQNYKYYGPFTLPSGAHTVYYLSSDKVGNEETPNAVQLLVAAGAGTVSGVITTPELPAGSTVTIVLSTGNVNKTELVISTFEAQGTSFNYALELPAHATYYMVAFAGVLGEYGPPPGTPIGVYADYEPIYLSSAGALVQNINLTIAADTQQPETAITSVVDGSTITALTAITGTASDGIGVSYLEAAVQDLTNGLWWRPEAQLWASTGAVPTFEFLNAELQGVSGAFTWTARADLGTTGAFNWLSTRLANGHSYKLYLRATDFTGTTQQAPAEAGFTWNGAQGNVVPDSVQGYAGTAGPSSVAWSWQSALGATGYSIHTSSGGFLSSETATSFMWSGLGPNSQGAVCVAAYNQNGVGPRNCSSALYTLAVPPGNPAVSGVTDASISVYWGSGGNPAGTWYDLRGSTDNFETMLSTAIIFQWNTEGAIEITIPGLEADTTYSLKVRALNNYGLPTEYSAFVSTKTLVAFPKAPVNPTASLLTNGQVMFSWSIPSGQLPSIYNVYRSSSVDPVELVEGGVPEARLRISAGNTATSVLDTPGISGLFYYAVTAFNSIGQESLLSDAAPVFLDVGTPSADIIFPSTATPLGVGAHPVTLEVSELLAFPPTLTVTPGAQSPVLLRLEPADPGTPTVWKGTFTVTQQTSSGEAVFSFSAQDLAGNIGTLINSGGTIGVDTKGPSAYADLDAAAISHGSLGVTIRTDEQPVSTPTLSLITSAHGAAPVELAAVPGEALAWAGSINIPEGYGDGTARLEYAAMDAAGNTGTLLSGATFFTIDNTPPGVPGSFQAAALAGGAVRLTWGKAPYEIPAAYAVYRDSVLISSPVPCAEPNGDAYFVDAPGDGAHTYAVAALDALGNMGAQTTGILVDADSNSPQPPADVVVSVDPTEQVALIWQAPSQETLTYRVYRSTSAGLQFSTVPVLETAAIFAAESLAADGTYYYVVTAVDTAGNESSPSTEHEIFYDKAAPVITIFGVVDGKAYSSAVFPVYAAADANLASLGAALDGVSFASGDAVSAEGSYLLTVSASDTGGHNAVKTAGFAVDKTSPTITITGAVSGLVYHSTVSIQAACADLRLATTTFLLNGEPYVPGQAISKDGAYVFSAEALDTAGNLTTAGINFSLDSPPPAPVNFKVEAHSEGGASLTWEKPESDVAGYRIYRDGVRISAGLNPPANFYDGAYSNAAAHTYEVCAIDGTGQEGARASIIIPQVNVTLQGYGSMVGGTEALNRGFFDTLRPAFSNGGAGALALGAEYLDLSAAGMAEVVRSTLAGVNISGGASAVLAAVVVVDPSWPDSITLKATAVLPSAPGTEAVFSRSFVLNVRNPVEPVLEVSHQPFVQGADAAVRLKFNNRGSAALDIETARVRDNQLIEGGIASVELRASGGLLLARRGLTQTTGVQAAMLDSTLPGDGEPEKELTYYASIPAGSSFLFAPVMAPVPAAAAGKLLLSASVTRPAFDLSSAAVGGLGVFQVLLEEAAVSSAPYNVSVAPGAPVYDQNNPVTLAGEARALTGELMPGASVQVEVSGRGYPRVLTGFTDGEGHYAIEFNPMPDEAGIYTLAAFPPEAANHAIQSTFTITGFAFEPVAYAGSMSQNSTLDFSVALKNTGETPLTGLSWQLGTAPGTDVTLLGDNLPSALGAGTRALLNLRAQAGPNAASQAEFTITATDINNGFVRTLPVRLAVMQALPQPVATPAAFATGIVAGQSKTQTILLQNKGFNTWSGVNVVIASEVAGFVTVQGSPYLGDIAPGGSASLVLNIAPDAELPSYTYDAANLVEVRASNAATLAIEGAITVTTTGKGTAAFTVINGDVVVGDPAEFIPNADIALNSMAVPDLNFTARTGADGKAVLAEVPAGNYTYKASYGNYQQETGRLTIEPGLTSNVEAVLVQNNVSYSWSVTPTTIQDFYDIKLDMAYEAQVGMPMLVSDTPLIHLNAPAGSTIYTQVTLKNMGLVPVTNVQLEPDADESGIRVEMPFTSIARLDPGQSVVVPLKIYIVHTSCNQKSVAFVCDYDCPHGNKKTLKGILAGVLNGGLEKACNYLAAIMEKLPAIFGGGGVGPKPCKYAPKIDGPDTLTADATSYFINPPPSKNPCPECDPLKCTDFVWTAEGDVEITGGHQGCSVMAKLKAILNNDGAGFLSAAHVEQSKSVNGCKATEVTIVPDIDKYQNTTSVKGPALSFHADVKPEGCAADLEWTITGNAGKLSNASGLTNTFTPTISQANAPDYAVIVANDKRNTNGRVFGTAKVFVEPLSIKIIDVSTPSEYKEPKGENSFIAPNDTIVAKAEITPLAAHEMYKTNVQWVVPFGAANGQADITNAGEVIRFSISQPLNRIVPPYVINPSLEYDVQARISLQNDNVSYITTTAHIKQDPLDTLRQEYVDAGAGGIPPRQVLTNRPEDRYLNFSDYDYGIVKWGIDLNDKFKKLGITSTQLTSAYRNPIKELRLSGSLKTYFRSYHVFAQALDYMLPSRNEYSSEENYELAIYAKYTLGAREVILYSGPQNNEEKHFLPADLETVDAKVPMWDKIVYTHGHAGWRP